MAFPLAPGLHRVTHRHKLDAYEVAHCRATALGWEWNFQTATPPQTLLKHYGHRNPDHQNEIADAIGARPENVRRTGDQLGGISLIRARSVVIFQ